MGLLCRYDLVIGPSDIQNGQRDIFHELNRLPVVGQDEALEVPQDTKHRVYHIWYRGESILKDEPVNIKQLSFR